MKIYDKEHASFEHPMKVKKQIKNTEQYYGHHIVHHKREAHNAVESNEMFNVSGRYERDHGDLGREHFMHRKHKLSARIAAEPKHHDKHHANP